MADSRKSTPTKSKVVKLQVLPDCDVCKLIRPTLRKKATADSMTKLGPWGYTCDDHEDYRVGQVTILELAE